MLMPSFFDFECEKIECHNIIFKIVQSLIKEFQTKSWNWKIRIFLTAKINLVGLKQCCSWSNDIICSFSSRYT